MHRRHERIPTVRYAAYASLVMTKRVLGMNPNRHRNYMIWKLLKLLDSGRIDRNTLRITSKGKIDGAGAQGLAKISAMCLAKAYGLGYVHSPFESLAHAEIEPELWTETWERLLNMQDGRPVLDTDSMQVVGLGKYVNTPDLWTKEVVLTDRHFHPFCELAPYHGSEVAKDLRLSLPDTAPSFPTRPEFVIGVHVRRGDVSANNQETKHRYTISSHTISVLEQVIEAARAVGHDPLIRLHSNGSKEELSDFSSLPGLEYRIGRPAVEDFISLAMSDILITTRSDFSMLAAYYCKGIVVCDPRHRTPLPEWIKSLEHENKLTAEVSRRLKPQQIRPDGGAEAVQN